MSLSCKTQRHGDRNAKCGSLLWSSRCVHTDWLHDFYAKAWELSGVSQSADWTVVVEIQQKKKKGGANKTKNKEHHVRQTDCIQTLTRMGAGGASCFIYELICMAGGCGGAEGCKDAD